MYYRYYSRDDRRFGSWVVIAVISALITAGVLRLLLTPTAGAGKERLETVLRPPLRLRKMLLSRPV
jgi:hypothetical protein